MSRLWPGVNRKIYPGYMGGLGGGGGIHPYAKAFIDAVETDETPTILTILQKNIINNFVKDLLAINNVQTNFFNPSDLSNSCLKAVYPLLLNVNANKYNLCDPRNLDAANRLYIDPDYTITEAGVKGGQAVGYDGINTFFIPAEKLILNSSHICLVHDENVKPSIASMSAGCTQGTSQSFQLNTRSSSDQYQFENYYSANGRIIGESLDSSGIWIGSATAQNAAFVMRNTTILQRRTTAQSGTLPTIPIYLLANNNSGTIGSRCPIRLCYASLGGGITEEAAYHYQIAINKFLHDFKNQLFFLNPNPNAQYNLNLTGQIGRYKNDELTILSVYDNKVLKTVFGYALYNNLFVLKACGIIDANPNYVLETDFDNTITTSLVNGSSTDLVSPFQAQNNGVFVGGNHSYNNLKTANSESYTIYADNVAMTDNQIIAANEFKIVTRNAIYNATDLLSSVFTIDFYENQMYTIKDNTIDIDVNIEFVKQTVMNLMYGLSMVNDTNRQILVNNSDKSGYQNWADNINWGTFGNYPNVNYADLKDALNNVVRIGLNSGIGVSKLVGNSDSCFLNSSLKAYHRILTGSYLYNINDTLNWGGFIKIIKI